MNDITMAKALSMIEQAEKASSEPPKNSSRGGKLKTVCREWNND